MKKARVTNLPRASGHHQNSETVVQHVMTMRDRRRADEMIEMFIFHKPPCFWIYLLISPIKGECQQIMDTICMNIRKNEYSPFIGDKGPYDDARKKENDKRAHLTSSSANDLSLSTAFSPEKRNVVIPRDPAPRQFSSRSSMKSVS